MKCKTCGKKFTTRDERRKYCSPACSNEGKKKQANKYIYSELGNATRLKYVRSDKYRAALTKSINKYLDSQKGQQALIRFEYKFSGMNFVLSTREWYFNELYSRWITNAYNNLVL